MNESLHLIDGALVVGYLIGVLTLGLWVGRTQQSTTDYFLGGRALPWWAILLSIVATETSTVTFLSIPGITFATGGDLRFLQITFGYIVGRLLVAWILLPLYFRGQPFTSYEVLEHRFGITTRRATSLLFLATRNLSDGLRLYLTAIVLQQVIGLEFISCVILIGAVTIVYTFFGGVKSVVWNDCLQFAIYMIGAAVALNVILSKLPGGIEQLQHFAQVSEKFRLLDFDFVFTKPKVTFWAGLVGGTFLTMATHGTDQLTVQRYLAAKSPRAARWAVILSGPIVLLQFTLFLIIGVALACFYESFPPPLAFGTDDGDRVFAHFIVHDLGKGLAGLTLAAVFAAAMSTLSSSLNSSATALINDLYLPMKSSEVPNEWQLVISRVATIGFGVLQCAIAVVCEQLGATKSTVNDVLKITSFALGPILGIYFIGVLTRSISERAALVGFVGGIATLLWVDQATDLYWPWYAGVGAAMAFAISLLASRILGETNNEPLGQRENV